VSLLLVILGFIAVVGFGFFDTDRTGADQVNTENAAVGTDGRM
jgi:hypothetical protein